MWFLVLYYFLMCLMLCRRFKFNGFEYVMKCLGFYNIYGEDYKNKEIDLVVVMGEWWYIGVLVYE